MYDRQLPRDAQLYYPVSGDPGAGVADVFGDAILVNGKLFPYHDVEPRKYRFRVLNTSNSRILHLSCRTDLRSTRSEPTRGCCRRRLR